MKKQFILMAAFILFAAPLPSSARNYYVKTSGLNTLQGTNWATAWKTAGYAATNAASGDIVIVSNGAYNEEVIPLRNRVVFASLNRNQAVILGANNCFNLADRTNIIISGFVLKRAANNGVLMTGASVSNLIMNNMICSNSQRAVYLNSASASYNTILSNNIYSTNHDMGIQIRSADNNLIAGNRIRNYGVTGGGNGIIVDNSADRNTIRGNSVYSNAADGIYISSGSENLVLSNAVWCNQDRGIYIDQAVRTVVAGNQCVKNASGIFIDNFCLTNTISGNAVWSNISRGIRINADTAEYNSILDNDIWGFNQGEGIDVWAGDYNLIRGNRIRHGNNTGLFLNAGAMGNIVLRNIIYSNYNFAVRIANRENVIRSNDISWNPSASGIYNGGGDRNLIEGNLIRHNAWGVSMSWDSCSNQIVNNRICSNVQYGIYLNHDDCEANLIRGNAILGPGGQQTGIYLSEADRNLVSGNIISGNTSSGILIENTALSNVVSGNSVSSNVTFGIYINSDTADYNAVRSNRFSSEYQAVVITSGDNSLISRNLIRDASMASIWLGGSALNTGIANNTVFGSVNSSALWLAGTSSGFILNNIMLSNGRFGITNASTGTFVADYNLLYGNALGPTNGGLALRPHNLFQDPLLDTASSFRIAYSNSPAIDSATNIPGITDVFLGTGPDMGWKEFNGTNAPPPSVPGPTNITSQTGERIRIPDTDALVYNNLLNLSGAEPARIIFGKAGHAEISIYNIRGVLVKSWALSAYAAGDYREWDGTVGESGKKAGAGVYFVLIKGDINKKLKLIIK